jgi:ribosome-associated translation inhibitor RaiA
MDLTVVMKLSEENRKPEVGAYVQKHLAHKLGKIQTRWGKPLTARLVALETPEGFEVTVALQGDHDLVAKAHETKLPKAVDVAVDKLTRQFEQTTQLREGRERNRRQTPAKIPMEF